MNPRLLLALIIVPLGLVIAAVPENKTRPFRLTAQELLVETAGRTQFISPETVAEMIVRKDPSLRLIDVRSPEEFEKYSLPGAINIPLPDLLSDEYADILDQDIMMNVFYSNGSLQANEAWMITRQLGYRNNFVLEGGLNYWYEAILNPQKPSALSPDEEFLKYDLRKGAGMALGGGSAVQPAGNTAEKNPSKPAVKPVAKKKKAAGGC